MIYLSEQGKLSLFFSEELYTPDDVYSCNFHCIFHFFLNTDCQQFSICLSLQQLESIHVLISAKGVGSNSAKCVTSGVPIAPFES